MNTATPLSTTASTVDALRERFAAALPTVTSAADAEEARAALAALRESFEQMATLATVGRPRLVLPNWEELNRTSPLVEETLVDTACRVALHLEGIAFAIGNIAGDDLPGQLGPSLAQNVDIAIAALRAHLPGGGVS